jgi:hypothetical protein
MTLRRARSVVACDRVALALAAVGVVAAGCGPDTATCDDEDELPACLDGDACLGGAHVVETSVAALHLVSANLDGDGQIDVLAIGTREDGTVAAELHRGHGDGTFAEPVATNAVGCSAYPLDGDLDGDAIADLVYPDCDGSLLVFWGGTDGPGTTATLVALPFLMTGSSIADMDGDGISDLVLVGHVDASAVGTLGWVTGAASRELALVTSSELAGLAFLPTAVRSGDANGDGTPDAFAYARGVADIGIAPGEAGGFAAAVSAPVGARVGQVAIGAFASASAAVDVLVASPDDMRIVVTELGAGTPAVASSSVFPYRPALATAVEWDGEPGDEAILADGFDPEVRWFRFAADGAAHEDARVSTPYAAQLVLVPDLDGDGTSDLLVAHFAQSAFSVRLSGEGAP